MATKAELEARIAELERQGANSLAVIDALSDARGVTGVRVVGETDARGTSWTVCVIGRAVQPDQGARIAAVFVNTMRVAQGLTMIAADAMTRDEDESEGEHDD